MTELLFEGSAKVALIEKSIVESDLQYRRLTS